MFAKAAIVLILLAGNTSNELASISDQKLDAFAAAVRAVTSQGLFAEEYDAILEVAQDDPQLREKIIEQIMSSPR